MGVLANHLSEGEVEQIRGILPEGLRDLWPAKATTEGQARKAGRPVVK